MADAAALDAQVDSPERALSDAEGKMAEDAQPHVEPVTAAVDSPTAHDAPYVEETCEDDPTFSSICSFFFKFGSSLGLSYGIEELKLWLEDSEEIAEELIELHIKLLRKRRKWINKDKWEKALVKYVAEYSNVEAWELERYGYKNVKLSIRLEVLKRLLEAQFDYNTKFKTDVNSLDASSLRILPIGRDVKGNQYWYHLDPDANVRVYREFIDDEKSWSLVCKDKDQLSELIKKLETENTIDVVKEESSANVSESDSEGESVDGKEDASHNVRTSIDAIGIQSEICNSISDPTEQSVEIKQEPFEETKTSTAIKCEENTGSAKQELLNHEHVNIKCEPCDFEPYDEHATTTCNFQKQSATCDSESDHQTVKAVVDHLVNSVSAKWSDTSSSCRPPVNGLSEEATIAESVNVIVNDVCNYLIDNICTAPIIGSKVADDGEKKEEEDAEEHASSGRGRGRPRRGARGAGARGAGRGRGRSRAPALSRELRELNGVKSDDEIPDFVPVKRQSRRIQVLQEKRSVELAEKMKKEQERLEELARRRAESVKQREQQRQKFAEEEARSQQSRYKSESDTEESESEQDDDNSNSKKKRKRKKKKHRKGRRGKRGANFPWDSSNSDEASQKSESDEVEEEEDEVLKFDDNEDEFACEEEDPTSEPVVLKRARTAKKAQSERDSGDEQDGVEEQVDDTMCRRCGKGDHPEWILLCDKCDAGFHTACLIPPLMIIPDGDWFCPPCENAMLIEKLQEEYSCLEKLLHQRELEDLKKERIKFVSISAENIIQEPKERSERKHRTVRESDDDVDDKENDSDDSDSDESDEDSDADDFLKLRSTRNRTINYQFKEYDDLINSAIRADDYEEEQEEVPVEDDGYGRGKDMATIEKANKTEELSTLENADGDNIPPSEMPVEAEDAADGEAPEKPTEDKSEDESEPESPAGKKKAKPKKGTKKRKLNDLDSPTEEEDSDESFKGSSATEVEASEEEFAGSDSEATEQESDDDSDFATYRRRASRSGSGGRAARSKKSGKKGGKSKKSSRRGYRRDDFVVDSDEDYTASGSRVRTRKAAAKRRSYKEVSSETEEEEEWHTPSKKKKKRGGDDSSESSDAEWGAKGRTKGKKAKKSWGAFDDDEEETEEEEDAKEDENSEEQDSDASEEEKPPPPPVPKSKAKKTRGFEMRGKPRLSKARLMSLKEKDSDAEESEDSNSDQKQKSRRKKKAIVESESEQEEEDEKDDDASGDEETESVAAKAAEEPEPVPDAAVDTSDAATAAPVPAPISKAIAESPLIAAALSGPTPSRPAHELGPAAASSSKAMPMMSQGHPELSALSQLTAFASRGPNAGASPPSSQPSSAVPSAYNNYPPNQQPPPPPPLIHTPSEPPRMDSDAYSLTPLDSFGSQRQKPLKPTLVNPAEAYPPRSASPPRLLNLESSHGPPPGYHMPPGPPRLMSPYEHYPAYDPKRGPMQGPPGAPAPHTYPPGAEHYAMRGAPSPYPPPPHGYPAHHGGYYHPGAPYPPGRGPPHDMRRPMGPEMYSRHPVPGRPGLYPGQGPPGQPPHPQGPHARMPPGPPGSAPPPGNYYRGAPHEPLPGYYGHGHPAHVDSRGGPPHGAPHHGPFPGYPHAHPQYASFYGAPNGGFMIQNLLQHPASNMGNGNGAPPPPSGNGPPAPSAERPTGDIPAASAPTPAPGREFAGYRSAAQE